MGIPMSGAESERRMIQWGPAYSSREAPSMGVASTRQIASPLEQSPERPAVDHALARNAGEPCVRDRRLRVAELIGSVGVAAQREQAARFDGASSDLEVEILPCWVAVDLDRHAFARGNGEHRVPVGAHAGARPVHSTARMS